MSTLQPPRGHIAAAPTLEEKGVGGAIFFRDGFRVARRHVESVEILSERAQRTQLTVDFDLPAQGAACVETLHGGPCVFVVPVVVLAKDPPVSRLDLVDEDGRNLPLLLRDENAAITGAAISVALEQETGVADPELERLFVAIAAGDEPIARAILAWLDETVAEDHPDVLGTPIWSSLREILEDLATRSILWLETSGRPGERRSVKLRFDTSLDLPSIIPRRSWTEQAELGTDRVSIPFELEHRGDLDPRGVVARIIGRLATAFAFAPIDYWIDTPYLHRCQSYHLQISAPSGLDVRDLRLVGTITSRTPGREADPRIEVDRGEGHLFFSDADVEREAQAVVTFRVERRGFLSLAALSTALVAAMLWCFVGTHDQIGDDGREVAGAVLLVVPAVLIAFVVRVGEHALATRLLSGVRMAVLLAGMCSVAAAAALGGVRPRAWQLDDAFKVDATIASVVAFVLSFTWFLSMDWMAHRRSERQTYHRPEIFIRLLCVLFAGAVLVGYGALWPSRIEGQEALFAIVILWVILFGLYFSSLVSMVPRPAHLSVPLIANFAALAILGLALLSFVGVTPWSNGIDESWPVYSAAMFALVGVIMIGEVWIHYKARRNRSKA